MFATPPKTTGDTPVRDPSYRRVAVASPTEIGLPQRAPATVQSPDDLAM